MNYPIVFIHYGDAEYLKYTLAAAIKFNPGKKVYLLGDSENEHYKKIGLTHIHFNQFHSGDKIKDFDRLFNVVKGDQFLGFEKYKGNDYWIRFVFLRWFYINNFLKEFSIPSFWTFDSDTLIVSNLSQFEENFFKYDCTEQCDGSCMNGFVHNVKVVDGYVTHINDLFANHDYLRNQQEEFKSLNRGFAFTEMRAYLSFKEAISIKTFHLNKKRNGAMFDDCLCQDYGMEMVELKDGSKFKKLYQEKTSKIMHVKQANNSEYIRLNTINLSWLPIYIIKKIYSEALKLNERKYGCIKSHEFKELNFNSPVTKHAGINKIRNFLNRL